MNTKLPHAVNGFQVTMILNISALRQSGVIGPIFSTVSSINSVIFLLLPQSEKGFTMLLDSSNIFFYIETISAHLQWQPSLVRGFPFLGTNFLAPYIYNSSSDIWRFATHFHIPTITNFSLSKCAWFLGLFLIWHVFMIHFPEQDLHCQYSFSISQIKHDV